MTRKKLFKNKTNKIFRKIKVSNSRSLKLSLAITKAFNYALREIKSGALCAIVDASHQVQ